MSDSKNTVIEQSIMKNGVTSGSPEFEMCVLAVSQLDEFKIRLIGFA